MWQKKGFYIRDENTPVKSFKHSDYLNNAGFSKSQRNLFRRQYAKLIKSLGNSQFHWYFSEELGAKSSQLSKDTVLWEVDVSEDKVFKRVCEIA